MQSQLAAAAACAAPPVAEQPTGCLFAVCETSCCCV
jgi:hypothetical protein